MTDIPQLVIVRRNQLATFALLAQAFADEPNVRLIWDRRVRERRCARAPSDPGGRRRRDRRSDPSKTWGRHDYLLHHSSKGIESVTGEAEATATPGAKTGEFIDISDVKRDIEAAVESDLTVLISGGDAVSRKSLAHWIHQRSGRANGPLIVVECDGFIETFEALHAKMPCDRRALENDSLHGLRAQGIDAGTVLIEEVTDLSWDQQTELSRFLEVCAVQRSDLRARGFRGARIIAGTSHWLLERIASKQFRAELFYQLNAIHLKFPSGARRDPSK